jgi:hypothetical protein
MSMPVADLSELLRSLEPVRQPGVYVFTSLPHGTELAALDPVVTVREPEGWTVVVEEQRAHRAGLAVMMRATWITLNVRSDLHAVGLTAAFASALAAAQISCNVVAGAYHDHIFVPADSGDAAMAVLRALQATA